MVIGLFSHYFFGISIFILSTFLVLLVLVQRGRGGGLVGALGGPGGQSALGTKAGDLFTRITVVVAAIWIFLCASAVYVLNPSGSSSPSGLIDEGAVGTVRSLEPVQPGSSGMMPSNPTPGGLSPIAPATTNPAITTPATTNPATTNPATTNPGPLNTVPTNPTPTDPTPANPAPANPAPANPAPTTPTPAEPASTGDTVPPGSAATPSDDVPPAPKP